MQSIQHITELYALDGQDFVTNVYHHLLRREPDSHGLAYYLGRLAQGHGKAAVIAQLARSPECRPHGEIKGLKELIAEQGRATHWFWGWLGRRSRLERTLQAGFDQLSGVNQRLELLNNAMLTHTQQIGVQVSQLGVLAQQMAQWPAIAGTQPHPVPAPPRLSEQTVRQVFMEILGREPESEETIQHHARQESPQALREVLLNSAEFQSRMTALPEYARRLFMRQLQLQPVQ